MTLKIGELCAGYGGLGMAVEKVFGAELAWVSEFDEAPSKILAHHWPNVPNYGDMTKIDWAAIEPVDIISGGTPCQDLSHAGRRAGMTEGTRSNLWVQMREAIATIKPTYVVWENVRGAYSAEANSDLEPCPGCMGDTPNRGTVLRALGRVLGDLSDLGYDCQWRGLRAADVGAPHGRFRVFILATRRAGLVAIEDPNGPRGGEGVHGCLSKGPNSSGATAIPDAPDSGPDATADALCGGVGRRAAEPEQAWSDNAPQRSGAGGDAAGGVAADTHGRKRDGRKRNSIRSQEPRAATSRGGDVAAADASGATVGKLPGGSPAEEARPADSDRPGDHRGERPHIEWGPYRPAIRRWESALGRRAPAPTEPTGRNSGHRLSARFAEFMMGVPDGWIVDVPGISRNEALKAAGNGVVPQQAAAALRDMLAHTNEGSGA